MGRIRRGKIARLCVGTRRQQCIIGRPNPFLWIPFNLDYAVLVDDLLQEAWAPCVFWICSPPDLGSQFALGDWFEIANSPRADFITRLFQELCDEIFGWTIFINGKGEGGVVVLFATFLYPFQTVQHDEPYNQDACAQDQLAASETQSQGSRKPEPRCGGNSSYQIAFANDDARSDKAHAGQDAQWKTH